MSDRLEGKRAFVTAGAVGIGRACALAFAREGATVFATDIDEKGLALLAKDGVTEVARLDVRDTAAVGEMAQRAGKVDILLNAAGFVHHGTVLECSDDDWDFSFDLNVKSLHRTIRAFLPGMLESGHGSIVNISSAAGVFKAAPNRYVYGATKAAVAALTRAVAADFITRGIRCNCICPGTIETPSMLNRAAAAGPSGREMFVSRQPMGRLGTADEIGSLAVYLASDESAITERFVASGARVAIWDHDQPFAEKTAKEIGAAVTAFKVDVSDLAAVEKTRDATLAAFGKIDILVNNAGIAGINRTVWETDLEEWRKVLRINLDGPFICCKAIVPDMVRQNYGRIVNIASIAGKEGNPNAAHYSASKAGVIALTKSLGKELAGYDIAVNCVTPAVAKTAIFDQMTKEHVAYMLAKIPRGRFVKVEEIADLVAFCASPECAFTTGAVFDISGGRATY